MVSQKLTTVGFLQWLVLCDVMYSAVCTTVPYLRSPHQTLHETLQTSNITFPTNTTILPLYLRQHRKYISKDEAKICRTTSSSPPCLRRPQPTILRIHLAPNAHLLLHVTVTTRPWCRALRLADRLTGATLGTQPLDHPRALYHRIPHSTSHYPAPTRDLPSLAPIAPLRIPLRLRTDACLGRRV